MSEYSYRVRSRKRKLRRRRNTLIGISAIIVLLIVCAVIKGVFDKKDNPTDDVNNMAQVEEDAGVIGDGVYIAQVSAGGMDYDEAVEAVNEYVKELAVKELNLNVLGNEVSVTLEQLGFGCETEEFVHSAFEQKEAGMVSLAYSIDEDKFNTFVEEQCNQFTTKAKNAGLVRKDGAFHIKKAKVGNRIDVDATLQAINSAIASSVENGLSVNVEAVVVDEQPEYTEADMEKCKDELGKFSTTFKEYQKERSANVRNAASFINGKVIYPGETFSVAEAIYPLTSDNGYHEAPSYADGQVVDSLGGGVCQVSTTLYNAVLNAELEIVQRSPHSMVVSYVEPAMDAAIAGDYKDLKFANNTNTPIYIHGAVYSGTITFIVYGEETRPSNRSIKYVSDIVETIEPGKDVVTKDKTQPKSYEKVTQEAHVGYVANLYKVVYEDGVEVSRDKVNYSKYNPSPRYVTKGTKKEKKKDKDKDKNKVDNNESTENDTTLTEPTTAPEVVPTAPPDAVDNSVATPVPEVTEAPVQEPAGGEVVAQ